MKNYSSQEVKRMFIQATAFARAWKNSGFVDEDLRRLELMLLKNPKVGDVITGTGRLRKVRFAFPNRGICEGIKMSEAFEILSAALDEAIEDAKSKNPKLERHEVTAEIKIIESRKNFNRVLPVQPEVKIFAN